MDSRKKSFFPFGLIFFLFLFFAVSCAGLSGRVPAAQAGGLSGLDETPQEENSRGTAFPLTEDEIREKLAGFLPKGFYPITQGGAPLFFLRDLEGLGFADIFLPVVFAGGDVLTPEQTEYSGLQKPERIYQDQSGFLEFWVFIFLQQKGELVSGPAFVMGTKPVLQGIEFRRVKEREDGFPEILALSFRSVNGVEEEWIIFDKRDFSRLSLRENLSSRFLFGDFTGNGYRDLLIQEKVPEEGVGYETYLTWYCWNGEVFAETASSNVVRNLGLFFASIKEAALTGAWGEVLEAALEPEDLKARRRNASDEEICAQLFLARDGQEPPLTELEFYDLVFPLVPESPFHFKPGEDPRFAFTLAARMPWGGQTVYRGLVEMRRNPYASRQFVLLPASLPENR